MENEFSNINMEVSFVRDSLNAVMILSVPLKKRSCTLKMILNKVIAALNDCEVHYHWPNFYFDVAWNTLFQ